MERLRAKELTTNQLFLPLLFASINKNNELTNEFHQIDQSNRHSEERYKNRVLPDQSTLPNEIKLVKGTNGASIYIVGTAHLSNNSNYQVLDIIQKVQPDRVMVELCNERRGLMYAREQDLMEAADVTWTDVFNTVKEKGLGAAVVQLSLMGATDMAKDQLHALPGAEFRVARKQCDLVPDCQVVLGDRRLSVTFRRLTAAMSAWEKARFVLDMLWESFSISQQEVEDAKNEDVLSKLMSEMKQKFPSAAKVIIDERDIYLTGMLQATARQLQKVPKNVEPSGRLPPVVVAVVGIGHQKGILTHFGRDVTAEQLAELTHVPPQEATNPTLAIGITALALVGSLFVCYKCSKCLLRRVFNKLSSDTFDSSLKSVKIA